MGAESAIAAAGPWAALGGSVLGSAASFFLGKKANDAEYQKAREQIRRQAVQDATTIGTGTARANASGLLVNGARHGDRIGNSAPQSSMAKYLADMGAEFSRERSFALRQAKQGRRLANFANTLQFASSVAGAATQFGQANNWWQAGPAAEGAAPTYTPGQGMPLWAP